MPNGGIDPSGNCFPPHVDRTICERGNFVSKCRTRDHVEERVTPLLVDHFHEGVEPPMFVIPVNPEDAVLAVPANKLEVVLLRPENHLPDFCAVLAALAPSRTSDSADGFHARRHGQQAGGDSCETATPIEQNMSTLVKQ